MGKKYAKVREEIVLPTTTLVVVKNKIVGNCNKCFFKEMSSSSCGIVNTILGPCAHNERPDNNDIIFVEKEVLVNDEKTQKQYGNVNELPIGTVVDLPFSTIKVEEQGSYSCDGCIFEDMAVCSTASEGFGECDEDKRADGKGVIFKQTLKV